MTPCLLLSSSDDISGVADASRRTGALVDWVRPGLLLFVCILFTTQLIAITVVHCPRCAFIGTSIRRVVNHMRVHSCEPDFRVTCGIGKCAATFRRYNSYRQHVKRKHSAIAGITRAPDRYATGNEHAGDIEQDASTSSEQAHVDSEGPSSGDVISDIRKQLVLFYLKITEKLKMVFTTADEIFTVMISLVHQILDGHSQNTLKFLEEENVASSIIEKLGSLVTAADMVEIVFAGLGSTHLRKKYVAEHFPHTGVTEVPLQAGSCNDSVCYIPVQKLLTSFLQSEDMLECLMQPLARSSDVLSDFADGDFLGQHHQLTKDDSHNTMFLLLYTDELEITNPLGSAAGQ